MNVGESEELRRLKGGRQMGATAFSIFLGGLTIPRPKEVAISQILPLYYTRQK